MNPESSDPVERAGQRRESLGSGDVTVKPDDSVGQKEWKHGRVDGGARKGESTSTPGGAGARSC